MPATRMHPVSDYYRAVDPNGPHRLTISRAESLRVTRVQRRHPDWPLCVGGCGWPVQPTGAGPLHPTCTAPRARGRRR